MRTFLALEINDGARQALTDVQAEFRRLDINATYPDKDQLHVTFAFFGELGPNDVREKADALHEFQGQAIHASLEGLGAFPKPDRIRVAWAGIGKEKKQVIALQQKLADALGYRNDQPFHPHVTLARIKSAKNKDRLQTFLADHAHTPFAEFSAQTLTLYESRLQPNGPTYVALERIQLQ